MPEQISPKPNRERPIFEYVEDLIEDRKRVGAERYKTPLQPGNGRDFGRDADEEMADWLFYWVGYRIEHQRKVRELFALIGRQATEIQELKSQLAGGKDAK